MTPAAEAFVKRLWIDPPTPWEAVTWMYRQYAPERAIVIMNDDTAAVCSAGVLSAQEFEWAYNAVRQQWLLHLRLIGRAVIVMPAAQ